LKNIFRLYFQLKVFSSLIYFKFNLLRYVLAQKAELGPFCAQQFDAVYVVLFQKVLGKRSLKAAPNALASKYIARRLATIASHEGLSIGANCDLAASAIALRTHHSTDSATDLEVQSRAGVCTAGGRRASSWFSIYILLPRIVSCQKKLRQVITI